MMPHNKMTLVKICPKKMNARNLGHRTNMKVKLKVQLSTRVAPKEKKPLIYVWYQIISYLCSGPYVRKWHCSTKTNHDVSVDRILDGGFVA